MKHLNKLEEFYNSLESIKVTTANLDKKRDKLKSIIDNFIKEVQLKKLDNTLKEKNKELGKTLDENINTLKEESLNWGKKFNEVLKREKFRSDLKNYFIVIIFGKVKAGKSSLGNFIAKNSFDNKATFFKYDKAGNEKNIAELEEIEDNNSGFATNNLECTSEIQGFKLGGMAWIDTPGIGSTTKENEELAKEYIQSADYIIYPTSSASPLQREEIEQLKELFSYKKTVTICISKSDESVRKKDSNGKFLRDKSGKIAKFLVNKREERREAQEQYVKEEIDKILNDTEYKLGDVLSISAHCAKKGLQENDDELFTKSNIPKLYELFTDIVKNKANKLKEETPYISLIAFVENDLLSDDIKDTTLKALRKNFTDFDELVNKAKDEFKDIKNNTSLEIETKIENISSDIMANNSINKNNAKSIFKKIDSELKDTIPLIINDNINKIMKDFNASLHSISNSFKDADNFNVKTRYETITQTYTDNDWKNLWGVFGDRYSTTSRTVEVGDNIEEVILDFKKDRIKNFSKLAIDSYEKVEKELFEPLQNISFDIQKEIDILEKKLIKFKNSLKDKNE